MAFGARVPELLYWSGAEISHLAVDGRAIYWAQTGARVLSGPKGPLESPAVIFSEARSGFATTGLVVDRENVYWTERRASGPDGSVVRRSPKTAAAPLDIARGRECRDLALAPGLLFWADLNGIMRMPTGGVRGDAAVGQIEVTQGIQNLLNEVPLVARKPTFVRVYAGLRLEGADALGLDVVLHGIRDGVPLPGSPLRTLAADDHRKLGAGDENGTE